MVIDSQMSRMRINGQARDEITVHYRAANESVRKIQSANDKRQTESERFFLLSERKIYRC